MVTTAPRGGNGPVGRLKEILAEDDLLILLCLLPLLFSAFLHQMYGDGWLTLAAGREVSRGLPHHDHWTVWATGRPWVDQQWLAQLSFYGLYLWGGVKAALIVNYTLLVATVAALLVAARRLGGSSAATAWVALLALPLVLISWQLRAEALALPLFALVLYLLVADTRRPSSRVLFVLPLLVLWANLHGSVLLGCLLVVLRACFLLRSRPIFALLLALPASLLWLVTPYGFAIVSYYRLLLVSPPFAAVISEWQPTRLSLLTAPFFLLAALALVVWAKRPAALNRYETLVLLLTLLLALDALRNIVWFDLAALMLLPRALTAVRGSARSSVPPEARLAVSALALTIALGLLLLLALKPQSWYEHGYPAAVPALVAHAAGASGTVFAGEEYADWLLLRAPSLKGRLIYDVRFELLDREQVESLVVWHDALGPGWQRVPPSASVLVLAAASKPAQLGERLPRRALYRGQGLVVFDMAH